MSTRWEPENDVRYIQETATHQSDLKAGDVFWYDGAYFIYTGQRRESWPCAVLDVVRMPDIYYGKGIFTNLVLKVTEKVMVRTGSDADQDCIPGMHWP